MSITLVGIVLAILGFEGAFTCVVCSGMFCIRGCYGYNLFAMTLGPALIIIGVIANFRGRFARSS